MNYCKALGLITIFGGSVGLASFLELVLSGKAGLFTSILAFPFGVLYCWGIWIGLRLIERNYPSRKNLISFWAIQVPYFISPYLGGYFANGACLYMVLRPENEFPLDFKIRIGAYFQYTIMQDLSLQLGINLFALAIIFLIARNYYPEFLNHQR